MPHLRASLALILMGALGSTPLVANRVHRGPTAGSTHTSKTQGKSSTKSGGKSHAKPVKGKRGRQRGQQSIDPDRVTEIQKALIRDKYLDGEPTGNWDTATVAAMTKLQSEQGWQTKITPDPRALKKLGLGADYSNALNSHDAGQVAPAAPGTTTAEQAADFATAAKVNR